MRLPGGSYNCPTAPSNKNKRPGCASRIRPSSTPPSPSTTTSLWAARSAIASWFATAATSCSSAPRCRTAASYLAGRQTTRCSSCDWCAPMVSTCSTSCSTRGRSTAPIRSSSTERSARRRLVRLATPQQQGEQRQHRESDENPDVGPWTRGPGAPHSWASAARARPPRATRGAPAPWLRRGRLRLVDSLRALPVHRSAQSDSLGNAARNLHRIAVRLVGVVLRAAIPGLAEREPVDWRGGASGAQLLVQRMEISCPAQAVVVTGQPGPVPVAVVVKVGIIARLAVAPGGQQRARVVSQPRLLGGGVGPGSHVLKPCAHQEGALGCEQLVLQVHEVQPALRQRFETHPLPCLIGALDLRQQYATFVGEYLARHVHEVVAAVVQARRGLEQLG